MVGFGPALPDDRLGSRNLPCSIQLTDAVELILRNACSEAVDVVAVADPLGLENTGFEDLDSCLVLADSYRSLEEVDATVKEVRTTAAN